LASKIDLTEVRTALSHLGISGEPLDAILTLVVTCAKPGAQVGARAPDPLAKAVKIEKSSLDLAAVASDFHRTSLRRQELLGKAADDPAWNMMLAIYGDQTRGQAVSVSSACHASGSAPTTALRYIDLLVQRGLLRRSPAPFDARVTYLSMGNDTIDRLEQLIESFCVEKPTFPAKAADPN
jgi:DNA-binding MarR family transcriptional regulator